MKKINHTGLWDDEVKGPLFLEVEDFSIHRLDPDRVRYFQGYFTDYFNDSFKEGMGTEDIIKILDEYGCGGRWMDIGAGTSTLFWALSIKNISEVVCCDISIEALGVLERFVQSSHIPKCYRDVMALSCKPPNHMESLRYLKWLYWNFNALKPWPVAISKQRFDLITAFGIFGIAGTMEAYKNCFKQAAFHLSPGGICAGADWIRNPECIPSSTRDYNYVTQELILDSCKKSGMNILCCKSIPIKNDPVYTTVIAWAMEKEAATHF